MWSGQKSDCSDVFLAANGTYETQRLLWCFIQQHEAWHFYCSLLMVNILQLLCCCVLNPFCLLHTSSKNSPKGCLDSEGGLGHLGSVLLCLVDSRSNFCKKQGPEGLGKRVNDVLFIEILIQRTFWVFQSFTQPQLIMLWAPTSSLYGLSNGVAVISSILPSLSCDMALPLVSMKRSSIRTSTSGGAVPWSALW